MNTGNAKRIGLAILVIGLALILFPQRIEMHIYPEQVQGWEDSLELGGALPEPEWVPFEFDTGEISTDEGFDHRIYVANSESALMNVTFWLVEDDGALTDWGSYIYETAMIMPPERTSVRFLISGGAFLDASVTVEAGLQYLRSVPSEYFWVFPYRYPGIAVAAIGLVFFALYRSRGENG